MEFFFLIIGIAGLWAGTSILIKGALNIARYYQLSHLFVGLTIVALGTDLPEVFISLQAAARQLTGVETSGVIAGTSIGSCIGQISIVLAISIFFGQHVYNKSSVVKDGSVMIAGIFLTFLVSLDGTISRTEGLILILTYFIYYASLVFEQRRLMRTNTNEEGIKSDTFIDIRRSIFYLLVGFIIVIFMSDLTVSNTVQLAERLGIPQSFIAIFIIGLGSSLPELVVSLRASVKGAFGLSLGNIIGSNIFDILIPLGGGALISRVNMEKSMIFFDLPYLFAASVLILWLLTRTPERNRSLAFVVLSFYILYAAIKIIFIF